MPRASTQSRVESLAREHTEKCITTLAAIMTQPHAPHHARILAANSLLSRGWGLPVAQVETAVVKGELREWLAWMRRDDIKIVNALPNDTNALTISSEYGEEPEPSIANPVPSITDPGAGEK